MGRKTTQHRYFSEELWEQVNKKNKNLLDDFMSYMKASDKSPHSINVYHNNLQIFFIWALQNLDNKFFIDLTKKDVMKFQNFLVHEMKLSPARVRMIRSSLSSMANYIVNFEDESYPLYQNIINRIPPPPLQNVREKTYLNEEQIKVLLKKLREKGKWQQALYVAISFASGARKAEVRQFRVSDFTEETLKNGLYKTSPIRCKGRGQIGKVRILHVPKDMVQEYLDLWLQERISKNIDCEYLFVSKDLNGEWSQVGKNTFNQWCDTFSNMMSIDIFPHAFRASIATELKNSKGKNITAIQKLLGHQDIKTTSLYIRDNEEEDIEDLFN